jgi:hypothetical protein
MRSFQKFMILNKDVLLCACNMISNSVKLKQIITYKKQVFKTKFMFRKKKLGSSLLQYKTIFQSNDYIQLIIYPCTVNMSLVFSLQLVFSKYYHQTTYIRFINRNYLSTFSIFFSSFRLYNNPKLRISSHNNNHYKLLLVIVYIQTT